jgi:hypothetical protein
VDNGESEGLGGASQMANVGGAAFASGGTASAGHPTGGDVSISTGGNIGLDLKTVCSGTYYYAKYAVPLSSCETALPPVSGDSATVIVLHDCIFISNISTADAGMSGYDFNGNVSSPVLRLLGSTCSEATSEGFSGWIAVESAVVFAF